MHFGVIALLNQHPTYYFHIKCSIEKSNEILTLNRIVCCTICFFIAQLTSLKNELVCLRAFFYRMISIFDCPWHFYDVEDKSHWHPDDLIEHTHAHRIYVCLMVSCKSIRNRSKLSLAYTQSTLMYIHSFFCSLSSLHIIIIIIFYEYISILYVFHALSHIRTQ